jgi:uncharacterized protein YlxW (UPF0749 family)
MMTQTTSELSWLRTKVTKQRNEIARLQQVVARLATEKAELLLDVKMYKTELEKHDGKVG